MRPLAPQALIVDDDVESIRPLQLVLRSFGFEQRLLLTDETLSKNL